MDFNQIKSAHEITKRQLAELKTTHARREAYFENFSTQLFRTIHGVGPEHWPAVFGKLHEDFLAGRDKVWGVEARGCGAGAVAGGVMAR